MIAKGEDALEMGGYFIINGIEKLIRMTIIQRRHFVYITFALFLWFWFYSSLPPLESLMFSLYFIAHGVRASVVEEPRPKLQRVRHIPPLRARRPDHHCARVSRFSSYPFLRSPIDPFSHPDLLHSYSFPESAVADSALSNERQRGAQLLLCARAVLPTHFSLDACMQQFSSVQFQVLSITTVQKYCTHTNCLKSAVYLRVLY